MLKTGPWVQVHRFPSVVSSTQQRQAPRPQAILFSRLTSQSIFRALADLATASIIGFGPQQYIMSYFPAKSGWSVTNPFVPTLPSSVQTCTFPNRPNS